MKAWPFPVVNGVRTETSKALMCMSKHCKTRKTLEDFEGYEDATF